MNENLSNRSFCALRVSLVIDSDAEGKFTPRVIVSSFDQGDLACGIETFEVACAAARAAEAVWKGEAA